jgi:hypothetical protein
MNHGKDVAGAEETFIISIGPEIAPAGEVRESRNTLGEVASRAAAAVGLKYDRAPVAASR